MPSEGTFGIIAPHPPILIAEVGGREAETAMATLDGLAEARAALERFAPETIVLMSPHAPTASEAFVIDSAARLTGTLAQFDDHTQRHWPGDPTLAQRITEEARRQAIPILDRSADARLKAGWLDHGTIVPMAFLDPDGDIPLVVLSLTWLDFALHRRLGAVVRESALALDRRVAFVASGDLSHRLTEGSSAGFSPRGSELDAAIVDHVRDGALGGLLTLDLDLIEAGGECGLRSIITLGGFAGADPVPTHVLSYEGPWGVGYLAAIVGDHVSTAGDEPRDEAARTGDSGDSADSADSGESEIVSLARHAVQTLVHGDPVGVPESLAGAEYPARAGAFVSLHRGGMLRGCIGTIEPTRPTLAEEVVANAVRAASEDPRFQPLGADELDDLEINVDVLHEPEKCSLSALNPADYGVIVTHGNQRGLLLPDLEGVDTVDQQVSIARRKGGIPAEAACELQRFKVDRYT
jgi:AmmeMemoRadiSam system protein A